MISPFFFLGLSWFSFVFLFGISCVAVWVGALISCVKNETATDNTKIVWVLIIVLLHFFGAVAYLVFRRPQRIRELGH